MIGQAHEQRLTFRYHSKNCIYFFYKVQISIPVKPGSHIPPTYLGHPYGLGHCYAIPGIDRRLTCEVEHSPTSQASRRLSVVVGDENILCEHHLGTQITPVRRFDPYLQVKWLKIAPIRFAFRSNLSMSAIHRRCAEGPLE